MRSSLLVMGLLHIVSASLNAPRIAASRLVPAWVGFPASVSVGLFRLGQRPAQLASVKGESYPALQSAHAFPSLSTIATTVIAHRERRACGRSLHTTTKMLASLSTSRKLEFGERGSNGPTGIFRNRGADCMSALVTELQHCEILASTSDETEQQKLVRCLRPRLLNPKLVGGCSLGSAKQIHPGSSAHCL